jgi:hypothetical protein
MVHNGLKGTERDKGEQMRSNGWLCLFFLKAVIIVAL